MRISTDVLPKSLLGKRRISTYFSVKGKMDMEKGLKKLFQVKFVADLL